MIVNLANLSVAVLFDGYAPLHENKDPGLIALGLSRIGCSVTLLALPKAELIEYKSPFTIMTPDAEKLGQASFWRGLSADVVICYTWLEPAYNSIIRAICTSGKKVVVKADLDGRLGYPVMPRQIERQMAVNPSPRSLWHWFRHRWLFGEYRELFAARLEERTEQIRMANRVIIETPKAHDNIQRFFAYWNRPELIKKFNVISNPVADDVSTSRLLPKQNIVASAARWDDLLAKNTLAMLKCARKFLEDNKDWRLRLLGQGEALLDESVSTWPNDIGERVQILGTVTHDKMPRLLGDARMFFMPSNWESWSLASSEAVCMGCTIVGTPLEPLYFLSRQGFSGTIASNFSSDSILHALKIDKSKHEHDKYDPTEIAGYWRPKLSLNEVALQIHELVAAL